MVTVKLNTVMALLKAPTYESTLLMLCLWARLQDQDGIAPQMFKSVIGRGHPEFSTNRQQDAQEFFMHLLSLMDRTEVCV